jgi:phage tail sheath protein FI
MPFQLSPGVLVVEKDLTNVIPAVASSIGAFVGNFAWGPANQPVTISSELELVKTFGKPNVDTYPSFFSAANFLSYSGNMVVVRQVGSAARNAVSSGSALVIANEDVWEAQYSAGQAAVGPFAAKFPGVLGNSLSVSMADSASFIRTLTGTIDASLTSTAVTGAGTAFTTELTVGDLLKTSTGLEIGTVASITTNTALVLTANSLVALDDATSNKANWKYAAQFDAAPGTSDYAAALSGVSDEMHIVVVDEDGIITGVPGSLLEKFANVSKAADAKAAQGGSNYYANVLLGSEYIYWMDHLASGLSGGGTVFGSNAQGTTFKTITLPITSSLVGGVSETTLTSAEIRAGYDLLADAETIDINLIVMGHHSLADGKYVIQNIAQSRMDCMVFVSPPLATVLNNAGDEANDILAARVDASFNVSSSYAVMDTGWKYQYDKYNDVYRWIPLNADVAGLCARTDSTNDPWFSPGGLNRGQIKNVVKLAYKPDKADRDLLYKKGVNPVVSFPGEGTVLFGDKTLLSKPSAFDRINVRRLFIVLEKAIATASKFQLFEFNDAFTRAQFRNLVEPFLRDVQGRRGVYDFRVICDETNNTGEVIDRNEFVADIYIKPARSINFITLNFIATRTGVAFEEVVGA